MRTYPLGRVAFGKRRINSGHCRNKTGVLGVSEIITSHGRGRGLRHQFVVSPMQRSFNIKTLGRAEAFRRAVELRAKHELAVLAKKGAR